MSFSAQKYINKTEWKQVVTSPPRCPLPTTAGEDYDCRTCNSLTKSKIVPVDNIHKNKLVCGTCNRYIKWMGEDISPEIAKKIDGFFSTANPRKITGSPFLSSLAFTWARERKLSTRQMEALMKDSYFA